MAGAGILVGAATLTAATTPSLGTINSYNAQANPLAITLPGLSSVAIGASFIVEKNIADGTQNTVTFTCAGTDTFDDASTALVLALPGEKRVLQVINIGATKYWKVTGGLNPRTGLAALTTEFALTNSATAQTIISTSLPPATLLAGSTHLIDLQGTVQVMATSGTLTFTPYLQGTALAQTAVMATQSAAAGPVAFRLQFVVTTRSTGTSGTAIAKPWGQINFATPLALASTSTATTTVNTSAAASSNALSVQAQWQTANTANSLLVETATIQRIL